MTGYILRRLAYMVPVFLLISLFVFMMVRLVPGDPAVILLGQRATDENIAMLRDKLKLDDPYWVQYVAFLRNMASGDLGDSLRQHRPVTQILLDRLPPTLFLVAYAGVLSALISAPLAAVAALNRGRWIDQIVRIYALVSLAMPAYWVGMMLLQFLAVQHRLFPVAGYGDDLPGHLTSLFLPALSLALAVSSVL